MVTVFHKAARLSAVATLTIAPLATYAQQIKVDAPQVFTKGKPFRVTYYTSGSHNIDVPSRDLNIKGLTLVYEPVIGHSTSVMVVNGQVSVQPKSELSYTFVAEQEGTHTISGIKLRVDGREVTAPKVSIKIVGDRDASSSSSLSQRETGQAIYRYQASVPKRTVYVQEPLPVTFTVLSTESPRITETVPATYDGFISLDLLGSTQTQPRIERRDGRDWVVADLLKELLFAQRAGKLTIPSSEITVRYTLRDPSGDPFFNQDEPRKYTSNPIDITVKPLPEAGKPDDFSGAVGSFGVRYELKSNSWRTNEATTLKIILEGQGNLKIAKLPKLNLPNDIELYDPVEHSDQSIENGKLHSIRTIEYSLIPRKTGQIQIPALRLSYFNPATARYEVASASAIPVQITQGKSDNIQTTIHTGREGSANTPYGIFVKPGLREFSAKLWLLALVHAVLALIGVISFTAIRRRLRYTDDTLQVLSDRASSVARKRLNTAHKYLTEGNREAFLEEVLRSIWGYLGDKLRLPLSELTREQIRESLQEREVAPEVISELIALIDLVEFARFAPITEDNSSEHLYDRVISVIAQLEKNLR